MFDQQYEVPRKRVTIVTPTPAEIKMQAQLDEVMRKVRRVQHIATRTETRMLKCFEALGVDIDKICLTDEGE